jgi:serralysin
MHELGHALGLKHGHEGDILDLTPLNIPGNEITLPPDRDSQEFSIMTYNTYPGGGQGGIADYPTTLMQNDILALQYLYGANYETNAGDTTYRWNPVSGELIVQHGFFDIQPQGVPAHGKIFMTIWDGGGNDTYDFSNFSDNMYIDLSPGGWSVFSQDHLADLDLSNPGTHLARGNVFNALLFEGNIASLIENAIGGPGHDIILGNQANNILDGGAGNNWIFGGDGDDILMAWGGVNTLIGGEGDDYLDGGIVPDPLTQGHYLNGGPGDDTYIVWNTHDRVDEGYLHPILGFGGFNTIVSKANWYWHVFGIGNKLIIDPDAHDPEGLGTTIVGGVWSNVLVGNPGTNVMFGRGGSDTYIPGDGIDFISLSLLGVPEDLYDGVRGNNIIVLEQRQSGPTSYAIVCEFDPMKDRFDVSDYSFGSTAEVFARGVNDGIGNSYFILGDGFDYAYVVGKELSALNPDMFIV